MLSIKQLKKGGAIVRIDHVSNKKILNIKKENTISYAISSMNITDNNNQLWFKGLPEVGRFA